MPFTVFDSPFHKQFLKSLNPAFKPPSQNTISTHLLDKVFSVVKACTDEAISAMPNINVSTDESSNIRGVRICNISVHSESGSYHYLSEDIGALQMNAATNVDWLRTCTLSKNDPTRVNSVTMDICSTMFSMWEQFEHYEDFKQCLFIPCDSHGIQLLIKDILHLLYFSNVLQQAQLVAKSFRKALLQFTHLRDIQTHFYNRHQSFILSVIMR